MCSQSVSSEDYLHFVSEEDVKHFGIHMEHLSEVSLNSFSDFSMNFFPRTHSDRKFKWKHSKLQQTRELASFLFNRHRRELDYDKQFFWGKLLCNMHSEKSSKVICIQWTNQWSFEFRWISWNFEGDQLDFLKKNIFDSGTFKFVRIWTQILC